MRAIILALLMLSVVAGAQIMSEPVEITRLGPKPPIERFPPQPYIAPPTPEEKAERKAEIQAMAALRERRQAAVAQILEQAAIVTNGLTKAQLVEARTAALEAAADVLSAPAARSLLTTRAATIMSVPTPIKSKEALP
jgi:hypothetical protein